MKVLKFRSEIDPDGHLHLDVSTQLPAGSIEVIVVINPVAEKPETKKYDFSDLSGKLLWRGDAVTAQRELRDEW